MRTSHILSFMILSIGIILISGCAEESTPAAGTDTTTTPATAASTSGCTSPYDGTWQGVISDSGVLAVAREVNGVTTVTHNPFTASFDFEMTIQCDSKYNDGWVYKITQVKASHPIFDCSAGCTPWNKSMIKDGSYVIIAKDGSGEMAVTFPNGALMNTFVYGGLQITPNGKMSLSIRGGSIGWDPIGWTGWQENTEYRDIETDNCVRLGGKGSCHVESINKNTMYLTKVS